MSKGKLLAICAILVIGSTFYFVMRIGRAQQSALPAPDAHTSCLPIKDYPNSNGYTESYTRANSCHSKKVIFYSGSYYRMNNGWRARCPAGATLYVHSRAHYMMSPTLDGDYDGGAGGGAHYYCVDAGGSQAEPVPGESEANPFHTHTFDGFAKVDVVDSDTDYYYSYKTGQWVSCPGGYQGPFQNSSLSTDVQYGHFNNHFHCKNPNYAAGSTSDNPESAPLTLTPAPSISLVGSFSTSDSGTKDQFVDKGPWGASAPLGTVSCVHSNSDKVYFSTTGMCPAVSQFPLKPTYSFELTKIDATIEAKTGATAWIQFKLKNNSTVQIDFPVYCDAGNGSFLGNMYYLNLDGTIGEKFVNSGAYSGSTSLPSANAIIPAGIEKSFQFKFDIPAANSVTGTWTVKCHTYPKDNATGNSLTDKKQEIANTLSVIASVVIPPPPPPSTGNASLTLAQLFPGQYSNTKFSITVADPDGVSEFSIKKTNGASLYGGNPSCAKSTTSGTVTIESADFPLSGYVLDCQSVKSRTEVTAANPNTGGGGVAKSCTVGEKCPSGSWCQGGSSCYYPDSQITCVAWPTSPLATAPAPAQSPTYLPQNPTCPAGTSPCNPTDTMCVAPGLTVPYTSGKWCASGSQSYYSKDGKNMTCVPQGETVPADYSTCRPDDKSCIPEGGYGPSNGWCSGGSIKCYQKTTDTNSNNDVYCAKMTTSPATTSDVSCPASYSLCSATDTNCKQKGDTWTDANSSYYCMGSQKCNLASGGGSCVSWNETCPAGTKYCSATDTNCIEPDSYKSLSLSQTGGYWCGGGGGMIFYSGTQAYCPPKKASSTPTAAMWTGAEIKEVLTKLGPGWGLCNKNSANTQSQCIEPGQTGESSGWCAWWPPNYTGPAMTPNSAISTRTCPSLDGDTVLPPPPPPIDEKHKNCGMMMYFKKNGYYVDEKGNPAPVLMPRPGYITDFKFIDDHYHLCSTPDSTPPICLQVITRAYNPKTNECQNFKDSCIPDGWIAGECPGKKPVPPGEIPECKPGESPFPDPRMYSPMPVCRMPMYRWAILEKKWEKCDSSKIPPYINVKDNPKATHTNCQSFGNFELEKEWMSERFLVHDPRLDGEWYMPPWDAAAEMYQYNPKTDNFEQCGNRIMPIAVTAVYPNEYYASCTPVPEKDKGWLLKKARAEYKMWQMWNKPGPEPPVPPPIPPIPPTPEIPITQCKGYLASIRQRVTSAKQFWKDVKNQLTQVGETYPDAATVEELLALAKPIILEIDTALKSGKCAKETVSNLEKNLNKLHMDIFPELSSYLPDINNFVQYGQCRSGLTGVAKQLEDLLKKNINEDSKSKVKELMLDIEAKLKEFEESGDEFDYDLNYECRQFSQEIDSQVAPLLRLNDRELNRIIDEVVSKKLEPVITQLSEELEQRGKKIDELLVQVAKLHQALEEVSTKAVEISEKIAVSYTALSRIEEQFADHKVKIQAAKDRLIPLVEEATQAIQQSVCLRSADRERMVQELGTIAAVNWLSEEATEMEKRLAFFIASCRAKSVSTSDVTGFVTNVATAASENLAESYEQGLTKFNDVPTHEWYYGAMLTAHQVGSMTQGRPAENVLKQDALLMILRASGAQESEIVGSCNLNPSSVSTVSPYAVCAVNYALGKGLVLSGPMTVPVSRVEMVEWLTKLAELSPGSEEVLEKYSDLRNLSPAEKSAIAAVVASKVMVGNVTATSATFTPRAPITRAALAVILEKLLQLKETLPAK